MSRSIAASLSVSAAALALAVIPASSAAATVHAGEFCAPKGATYRTATATLICAPALSASGRNDLSYRWRNITGPAGPRGARGVPGPVGAAGPACPEGYAQQLIQVQAIAAGATDPAWVQVMACVASITAPTGVPTSTTTSTLGSSNSPTITPTTPSSSRLDPRFATCADAKAAGYGPYREGVDAEYSWYRDADHDGVVCE